MTLAMGFRRLPAALARGLPLVLILGFPGGCLQSDDEPRKMVDTFYSIEGTVTNAQTLSPLQGVAVDFGREYGDSIDFLYRAETDSAGTYHYSNLGCEPRAGSRARFSKTGYETMQLSTASAVVRIGTCEYRLDLAMEAAESSADLGEQ